MNLPLADDEITVCTLNVNGLLDFHCQYSLKQFWFKNKIDVLFLQETDVSNLKFAKNLEKFFDLYRCYWHFGSIHGRGTSIFVSHSLECTINKYHKDLDGRFQFVDYRLLNEYAPISRTVCLFVGV